MVNDESRMSHDFRDELRGKPKRVEVHACERLSLAVSERPLGDSQGQNRNREIRPSGIVGGPEEMRLALSDKCARLGSIPTGIGFQEQISSHSKLLR